MNAPVDFEETKTFARSVADVMAGRMGDRVVARTDKRLRPGKVLIDWGQNERHKSTVAAYSLRAKLARPTVSAPLEWDELQDAVDAGDESPLLPAPDEVLARVGQSGDCFAPVLSCVQALPG